VTGSKAASCLGYCQSHIVQLTWVRDVVWRMRSGARPCHLLVASLGRERMLAGRLFSRVDRVDNGLFTRNLSLFPFMEDFMKRVDYRHYRPWSLRTAGQRPRRAQTPDAPPGSPSSSVSRSSSSCGSHVPRLASETHGHSGAARRFRVATPDTAQTPS